MKKILLLALLICTIITSFAQTQPVCGSVFTDPAGPNANYANSSDYTVTIFPTNPGEKMVTV